MSICVYSRATSSRGSFQEMPRDHKTQKCGALKEIKICDERITRISAKGVAKGKDRKELGVKKKR